MIRYFVNHEQQGNSSSYNVKLLPKEPKIRFYTLVEYFS